MKQRPVLWAGLLAGVTALASTAPPAHADVYRTFDRNRNGGRSSDTSDRGSQRGGDRGTSGSPNASRADRGAASVFGSGRPLNGSPSFVRPGNSGLMRPPVTYQGGVIPGGITNGPSFNAGSPRVAPYQRYGGYPSAVTSPPGNPAVGAGQSGFDSATSPRPIFGSGDPSRTWHRYDGSPNPSPRFHRRPGSFRNDTGTVSNTAPTFGQTGGVDGNGVTIPGRVLGTNRPVDRYGRTEAGRALNSPVYQYPTAQPRIDRLRPTPIFWYNPLNGRYERRRDGDGGRDWGHDRNGNGRHHRPTFINVLIGTSAVQPAYRFSWGGATHYVFYPYYCSNVVNINSLDYGYTAYPSPYYYYDYLPQFIPSTRVVYVDRPVYVDRDETEDSGDAGDADAYYLNKRVEQDVETAMEDIRNAWILGDIDLLLRHVRSEQDLGVYLKGKYIYSLPSADYRDLTKDAMKASETLGFKWVGVDRKSDDEAIVKAEHTFKDRDGDKHTVFVSYTLLNENGAWWIAEVGSSDKKETL